jgi:TP901 family phage tail tape measure protein/lambda family phage tail tape measure protein
MRLAAPEVLAGFTALRKEADALKLSLAGLGAGGGTGNFTRMQAEVNEMKAALASSRIEVEKLAKAQQEAATRAVSAKKQEAAAEREALAAKKQAAAEEEKIAGQRLQRQLTSAKMTSDLALRGNRAVEESLAKSLAEQDRMRDRALDRQMAQQQAAVARNERLNEQARARNVAAAEREAAAVERAAAAQQAAQQRSQGGIGRSALRGVAGAGGGMFLTYGQNIPAVVAGFGAAYAAKESIQTGSEFNYQTQFAGALGGMTPAGIKEMREELRKLGTDAVYGPVELAKGMRTLTQAGLEAGEALKVLPVATKVAFQGETDLADASEALINVMQQYKLKLADIPAIGDAISKTAAVTQANVKSLMESLKASTGVSMYGVDLNTSLANIGLLAKQGITGSSAGTFFRRFVEELYAPRSMDSQRAFREIGFTNANRYNGDGSRRDFRDVQGDFVNKMQQYDPESQIGLLSKMFDIRSLKDANALITDMSGVFTKLRTQIDDSKGSLDAFTKQMAGETKVQWEQVKNNFQGLLIDAFSTIGPQLNDFLRSMRDFFKDEGVTNFLRLILLIPAGYAGAAAAVARSSATKRRVLEAEEAEQRSSQNPLVPDAGLDAAGLAARRRIAPRRQTAFAPGSDSEVRAGIDPLTRDYLTNTYYMAQPFKGGASVKDLDEMSGLTPYTASAQADAAKKRASRRVLDPLGTKEQLDLDKQLDQAAQQRAQRETRRIQQQADFETRILDEKRKYELIGENAYTTEIERIQDNRRQIEVAMIDRELQDIESRKNRKLTEAQKEEVERRKMDLQFKRDEQLREAEQVKKIREIRQQGLAKQINDQTSKLLEGFRQAEGLRIEQRDLQSGLPFMRPGDAAEASARYDVRSRFNGALVQVNEDIKKSAGDGEQLQALKRRREELVRLRDLMSDLQGDEARLRAERERTWGYGQQAALRQWADDATNSAAQAREVWTTTLNGVSGALAKFVVTGKLQFKDLALSILEMLARIRIERALAGAVDMFLGFHSAGPGLGYGTAGTAATTAMVPTGAGGFVPALHTGGIVGHDAPMSRMVPMGMFANAPRFHSGGLVGDEMPIIARKGEGVFTPEQMSKMGGVTINITIEAGGAASVDPGGSGPQLQELGRRITGIVTEEIVKQQRPGGLLSRV